MVPDQIKGAPLGLHDIRVLLQDFEELPARLEEESLGGSRRNMAKGGLVATSMWRTQKYHANGCFVNATDSRISAVMKKLGCSDQGLGD